tara:strand:+ start:10578 stop:10697 length:120 start_codon:yes stop_codon:yes gene_type:complete
VEMMSKNPLYKTMKEAENAMKAATRKSKLLMQLQIREKR